MFSRLVFREKIMPIQRKAAEAGIFDESELALLGRVFDELKLDNPLPDECDSIASRIIARGRSRPS